MIVSLLSSSMPARNVGSSRVNRRSAFPMLFLVRVRAREPPDPVILLRAHVGDEHVARELALVDAQVRELTVPAVLELERERHRRLVVVDREHDPPPLGG